MSELFAAPWMQAYKEAWNLNKQITESLAEINFSSVIAYGLIGDDNPLGVLTVENGIATDGGEFSGQALNWDIRADENLWNQWLESPPNMTKIGVAYTTRRMQFKKGDYASMLREPRMAGPFIKSFEVMAQVKV
jgi:hypothetical protein